MTDLSGEKVRKTVYQAPLERGQVKKLHEAKQWMLTSIPSIALFLSAQTQ